ncbi:MAG TPA: M56 family metallopeptidase [Candidatus Dormibacteraeota bacterium]|nr:M56 family metallopeptidase [Candidatus Dormibacteraeota bacterium]
MTAALTHATLRFLPLLLDSALRSLLVAFFLAAVLVAYRVSAVRERLLAWRGLLLIALAMPLLVLVSPAISLPIPVPSFSRDIAVAANRGFQPPVMMESGASHTRRGSQVHHSTGTISSGVPFAGNLASESKAANELSAASESYVAAGSKASRPMFPWISLAGALYSVIAVFFLARLLLGMFFGSRLARTAQPIGDLEALRLLDAASRAAGLRQSPRLSDSVALRVPVTLGIFRPTILLPQDWRAWDADRLHCVLAHEVSHVARRDSLVQLVALLHRAVFWFSPLSWWLDRHLAGLSEQASDDAALSAGADRTRYAETLLDFLAHLETSPARVRWHGVAMAKTGQGEKRLERILSWRPDMSGNVKKSLIVALAAVCLPAVALTASLHPSVFAAQDVAIPAPVPPPPPPTQLMTPPSGALVPTAIPAAPANPGAGAPPQIPSPSSIPVLRTGKVAANPAVPPPPPSPAPVAAPVPPQGPAPAVPPPGGWGAANGYANQFAAYWPWGPRFVIVSKDSNHPIIHGTQEDDEMVGELRSRIHGDFIWFEHDGKSYVIRDQAIIDRAQQIWAQRADSAKHRQELQAKEQELSKQMREQVQAKMQEIRVKVPDMTAELQKLQSELKDLNTSGATMQQFGDLQRDLGEMQQALNQARWNSNMQEITQRAGELGQQMGELGRQIGEIASQEIDQSRQAGEQMRHLFDNAIASGAAKPE